LARDLLQTNLIQMTKFMLN